MFKILKHVVCLAGILDVVETKQPQVWRVKTQKSGADPGLLVRYGGEVNESASNRGKILNIGNRIVIRIITHIRFVAL